MANTFLYAQGGVEIGKSLCRARRRDRPGDHGEAEQDRLRDCVAHGCHSGEGVRPGVEICNLPRFVPYPPTPMILDFGPKRVADLKRRLGEVKTAAVERSARRLRDGAFRRGHLRARPRGGEADARRQARERRRRRRYGARAQLRRRCRRLHLCLDRRRRIPRMARRARRCRGSSPLPAAAHGPVLEDSLSVSFPWTRESSNHLARVIC